jgi:hypothetical protein
MAPVVVDERDAIVLINVSSVDLKKTIPELGVGL